MQPIYFWILILASFLLFLKYQKDILKLKKENSKLLKQLETQKCNNFNNLSSTQIAQQKESDWRKIKILEFLSTHETITNNQTESLLKVSNSTAYRLLEDLEQAGKVIQIGNTGKDVYYILNRYKK